MTSQLRRASYSIPSNIAEGSGKGSKEFARYLTIVSGSIKEVECFLLLARDQNYITESQLIELNKKLEIIGKMEAKLMQRIKQ